MRWTLVYEMNEMKKFRQMCNIPPVKYMKMGNSFRFFLSAAIALSNY